MTTFPGIAGEIEELIGVELTTLLLRRWGGCQVNLARRVRGSVLAEVVGVDAAEKIVKQFGAGKITLPCGSIRGQVRRRGEAMQMLRDGASISQVALACDMHTRTVSRLRLKLDEEGGSRQVSLPFDRD